jgi:hypothetical protein
MRERELGHDRARCAQRGRSSLTLLWQPTCERTWTECAEGGKLVARFRNWEPFHYATFISTTAAISRISSEFRARRCERFDLRLPRRRSTRSTERWKQLTGK